VLDLDSTRGFAALIVFLAHALFFIRLPISESYTRHVGIGLLRRVLDGGAAVDYFFVLSGFVLALPFVGNEERAFSTPEFWARRVVRIMPTYWAALAAALLLRYLCNALEATPADPAVLLTNWSKPLGVHEVISHIALIWRDFDTTLVNGPIWSLAVEMQISLLLPLFIVFLRIKNRFLEPVSILALSLYVSSRYHEAFTWLPLFVVGVIIAQYRTQLIVKTTSLSRASTLLLYVTACALIWNREIQPVWSFPDVGQEWLSGMGAAIVLTLVISRRYPSRLLANGPSRFLGKISYSFYLVHLPILQATILILRTSGWNDWLVLPLGILLSFAGTLALYFTVEEPSLRWGRQVSRSNFWKGAGHWEKNRG
jgi:peptidoglycan/LPS O-acetylase OafA/YrhL